MIIPFTHVWCFELKFRLAEVRSSGGLFQEYLPDRRGYTSSDPARLASRKHYTIAHPLRDGHFDFGQGGLRVCLRRNEEYLVACR